VFFRQLLNEESACASYLLGCSSHRKLAVVEPHIDLVEQYVALADAQGAPIIAVLDTHVQADHVSGMTALVELTGATAYLPEGADVEFHHHPLTDGEVVRLGNIDIRAIATPGHAVAHHAYLVTDHGRADQPWVAMTGDALLVGDAGGPDLQADGELTVEEMAQALYHSITERLLVLPDELVLCPSHYWGSLCGGAPSGTPMSTIGFERRHNPVLRFSSQEEFVRALARDTPGLRARQSAIVAANRCGGPLAKVG
jgi:glyoxylase-like metal-dependent hydrolase (beta-lactamase superfamily II)